MKFYNFNNYEDSKKRYGGADCYKTGILIDGAPWMIKSPRRSRKKGNSPTSEYIGSHIYESIGIPTQETLLGEYNGRLVVACKDFCGELNSRMADFRGISNCYVTDDEIRDSVLFFGGSDDYNEIRTAEYYGASNDIEEIRESLLLIGNENRSNVEQIKKIMLVNRIFKEIPELKNRFWEMYVIDLFIGNYNRRFEDWGMVVVEDSIRQIAPVFDNSCLIEVDSIESEVESILEDEYLNMDPDCVDTLLRVFPNINLDKIKEMIEEIPCSCKGIDIIPEEQKEKYMKCLELKYKNAFLPLYKMHHEREVIAEVSDEIYSDEKR